MISFELNGLPPLANKQKGHWAKRARTAKQWKEACGYMLLGKKPKEPLNKIHVVFTRFSSKEPDFDGLVHSFKPILDSLVEYGIVVDDKPSNVSADYRWSWAPMRAGKIRVEVK